MAQKSWRWIYNACNTEYHYSGSQETYWLKEEMRRNQKQRFWSCGSLSKEDPTLFLCTWKSEYLLKFYSKKADSQGSLLPHLKIWWSPSFFSAFSLFLFYTDLYNSKNYMTLKDSTHVSIWYSNVEIRGWGYKNCLMRHHARSTVSAPYYSLSGHKISQCKQQIEDGKEQSQKLTSFLTNSSFIYWHYTC